MQPPDVLVHRIGDHVAVAVADLRPGPATGAFVTGDDTFAIEVRHDVPLGHKVALRDLPAGEEVVEYGVQVGVTSQDVRAGDHVHDHNLRSARWHQSS